ncbi:hypothetical protein AGDE_13349 [Angomonas deanei]|nr:hypothetical protein AGDE_13349 [Angomonas deanei]|eukprot:EPY22462.1 hypothetical protein AGDE_13349 [Angomonas deanei]
MDRNRIHGESTTASISSGVLPLLLLLLVLLPALLVPLVAAACGVADRKLSTISSKSLVLTTAKDDESVLVCRVTDLGDKSNGSNTTATDSLNPIATQYPTFGTPTPCRDFIFGCPALLSWVSRSLDAADLFPPFGNSSVFSKCAPTSLNSRVWPIGSILASALLLLKYVMLTAPSSYPTSTASDETCVATTFAFCAVCIKLDMELPRERLVFEVKLELCFRPFAPFAAVVAPTGRDSRRVLKSSPSTMYFVISPALGSTHDRILSSGNRSTRLDPFSVIAVSFFSIILNKAATIGSAMLFLYGF